MAISKDMTIGEIVRNYPESIEVLMGFGMGWCRLTVGSG